MLSTLTTLPPSVDSDVNIENDNDLNEVKADPSQNTKTVECRLRSVYDRLAATEANIFMFETMKSMGLATNDVSNFVQKQSIHKRVNCQPDYKIQ